MFIIIRNKNYAFMSCLFVGSIHLNDCPREFHIPIFLIVFGGALILMSLCALAMIVFNRKRITVLVFFILHVFFLLFNLGWLIAGTHKLEIICIYLCTCGLLALDRNKSRMFYVAHVRGGRNNVWRARISNDQAMKGPIFSQAADMNKRQGETFSCSAYM